MLSIRRPLSIEEAGLLRFQDSKVLGSLSHLRQPELFRSSGNVLLSGLVSCLATEHLLAVEHLALSANSLYRFHAFGA